MKRLLFFAILFTLFACETQVQDDPINLDEGKDGLSVSEKYYKEGLEYYDNNDLEKAKASYRNAIEHAPSGDAQIQFKYYTKLIGVCMFKNEYGEAISTMLEFKQKDLLPELQHELLVLNTEQHVYLAAGHLQKAMKSNLDYYDLLAQSGKKESLSSVLILRGKIFARQNKLRKADSLFGSLERRIGAKVTSLDEKYIVTELGIQNFYKADYNKAISWYKKSLEFDKSTQLDGHVDGIATQYANIAEAYIELKNYEKARTYLDSFNSLNQSKVDNRLRTSVFKYELRLARALNIDNSRIDQLIEKTSKEQESLFRVRYTKELELLSLEKKNSENLLKKNQRAEIERLNLRNNAFLIGLVLIVLLLLTLFFMFKQKRDHELKNLKNQQRLLRAQMNPHFIFNVLSSIQNLVRTNAEQAPKFITKFSRLLRKVLENSTQNYVPLVEEVEVIRNYLDLQKLRFPKLFDYRIEVDESLEEFGANIPPMLIQPFVENAIEHGFKGINYVGELQLTLYPKKTNDSFMVHCVVSDNGQGIRTSTSSNKKSVSFSLISDFIEKATKQKIKRYFYHPETQTGTVIEFDIPTS